MACGGCAKRRAEMQKQVAFQKQINSLPNKPTVSKPSVPTTPPITKTRRQLRIEARTKKIAIRAERVRLRNLRIAAEEAKKQEVLKKTI